jgi:RNA methyltransferase, TrmH family
MLKTRTITSTQNIFIKNIIALESAKERKLQNLFVAEGIREIKLAFESNYKISHLVYCENFFPLVELLQTISIDLLATTECINVPPAVFNKLAYRKDIRNLIAIGEKKTHQLNELILKKNPLVVICENIEKPGNIGAILRTIDAGGVDALIVCDSQTDLYNPNVIRGSLGTVFTKQIALSSTAESIKWCIQNKINIHATYLESAQWYHQTDFTKPTAIVMGSEANGISKTWIENSTSAIKIPQNGKVDSMNVSNAAAIVIYEAQRQRGFLGFGV